MDKMELLKKAEGAKSVEELMALAKENDIELTEEKAKALFDSLNTPKNGELTDDDLDMVAGGINACGVLTDIAISVFGVGAACIGQVVCSAGSGDYDTCYNRDDDFSW